MSVDILSLWGQTEEIWGLHKGIQAEKATEEEEELKALGFG